MHDNVHYFSLKLALQLLKSVDQVECLYIGTMFTWNSTVYFSEGPIIGTRLTFVWGYITHRDTATVKVSEHDFGDAIVSQAMSGIPVPLVLREGNHRPHCTQETTIQVLYHAFLLSVTVHIHAVRWVNFAVMNSNRNTKAEHIDCYHTVGSKDVEQSKIFRINTERVAYRETCLLYVESSCLGPFCAEIICSPVPAWVFSGCFSFLPQPGQMVTRNSS